MSKIVCVVPTIRPDSYIKFYSAWAKLFDKYDVTLVTVFDGDVPIVEINEATNPQVTRLEPFEESPWKEHKDLFYRYTDSCRNIGFVVAAQLGADYIFTLDDDTEPVITNNKIDSISRHLDALDYVVDISWLPTFYYRDKSGHLSLPRGVPYHSRNTSPVMLSHGIWDGVHDWDGETQLYLEKNNYPLGDSKFHQGYLPKGVYYPLCFVPTSEVTLSDGSRKYIVDINIGDKVFTKDGKPHKVLKKIESTYNGEVTKIKVSGRDKEIVCTPNHNVLTLRDNKHTPEWIEASQLSLDDKLCVPIINSDNNIDVSPNISIAKLIGYFLAEGCFDKYSKSAKHNGAGRYIGLQFTFGTEKKKEAIKDCCESLDNLKISYRVDNPKRTATVITTNVYYELVNMFRDTYCIDEFSYGKRLPNNVFQWNDDCKRALLAAYWAGDGCFNEIIRIKGNKQYQCQAKTRSRVMALQLQLLMQSLGFTPNVSRLSPYKQSKECWAISLNGNKAKEFKDFLDNGILPERGKKKFDHSFCDSEFHYYPIKEISRIKYEGLVYNLTVEEDHSYLVEGLVVKNCGMNVMVRKEALPYLYYAPMGRDTGINGLNRFGDIWMGIFLKKKFDYLNWACMTGSSVVIHNRASNAQKNFTQEILGRKWNECDFTKDNPIYTHHDPGHKEFYDYFNRYAQKRDSYAKLIRRTYKKIGVEI